MFNLVENKLEHLVVDETESIAVLVELLEKTFALLSFAVLVVERFEPLEIEHNSTHESFETFEHAATVLEIAARAPGQLARSFVEPIEQVRIVVLVFVLVLEIGLVFTSVAMNRTVLEFVLDLA